MHAEPSGRFRIKHYNGSGDLLKAREVDGWQAIAADLAPDYTRSVQVACHEARLEIGSWQEIILGPPELAGAVDRLQIQAVL